MLAHTFMPNPQHTKLAWPMLGFVQNTAYEHQPEGSTTDCLNVRPYDAIEERLRGGKRTGLSKYIADAVGGNTSPVQALKPLYLAFDPNLVIIDSVIDEDANGNTDTFHEAVATVSDIADFNSKWTAYSGAQWTNSLGGMGVTAGNGAHSTSTTRSSGVYEEATNLGSVYILEIKFQAANNTGDMNNFGIMFRCASNPPDRKFLQAYIGSNGDRLFFVERTGGTGSSVITSSVPGLGLTANTEHTMTVTVNGDTASIAINGSTIMENVNISGHPGGGTRFGFHGASDSDLFVRSFKASIGEVPASLRTTKLVAVAAGDVAVGTKSDGLSVPATGGAAAMVSSGRVDMQQAFQDMFLVDGLSANYQYYDSSANAVKDWATDVTAGSLPAGSLDTTLGCKIIELYRGRIVMSGLQEEPQNWFMSKSGDPFDWDFAPSSTSAIQAVAGNNSNVGELGDVVTALAPWQDDIMMMGAISTLWIMRGDPAAGGAIDNLSRQVGIVGPEAWAYDSAGNFYFVGLNGFYRLPYGGGVPENLSQNRLDKVFNDLNAATKNIRLIYDIRWRGVHIFITPTNEPSASPTHYWWDERTDSFWPDQYPTNIGPTAVLGFEADNPADSGVLVGGFDGFVRVFDDATHSDDGAAIDSFVRFSPLHPGQNIVASRLSDINVMTDKASGDVKLNLFIGHSVEDAEDNADANKVKISRNVRGGRNPFFRYNIANSAIIPELSQNSAALTWAYEDGSARIELLDRMRGRGGV